MENKPKYLYRGIKVNYDLLKEIKLYDVDIKPHYEPLIDEFGRKTVTDGNEYGVYMSDNKNMVKSSYSKVDITEGTNIRRDLRLALNGRPTFLNVPAVGIVYEIDTEGLDIHKPWISSLLTEHYNNGYIGDEWIIESIPSQNYKVIEATIGPDLLHDTETINVTNIADAERQIKMIVEKRKYQLEILGKELEKLPPLKRMQLTSLDMQLYKDLYSDDGICYAMEDEIKIETAMDCVKYLLLMFYKENIDDLDYTMLKYIESFKSKITPTDSLDKLFNIIKNDIILNEQRRQSFIEKNSQGPDIVDTSLFDQKKEMYNRVMNVLNIKKLQLTKESFIKLQEDLEFNNTSTIAR